MSAAGAGKPKGKGPRKGPTKGAPTVTPLMRQYRAIKDEHRDKVLLFHLGDFYEMFDEDAKVASRALGITLTSRSGLPLAGFPVHAARDHIEKLLEAGHKVAICDQVEDPKKAKGIVRREVTRVITAGTLLDEGMLRADENNYLAAVVSGSDGGGRGGLAYVDLSTGEFAVAELDATALTEELERLRPAEILVPEARLRDGKVFKGPKVFDEEPPEYGPRKGEADGGPEPTPYPDWAFDTETARRKLIEHFRVKTLDAFGC
ncbi:MAG: MutS N-terminal domain-containing protein, partial [Planctomycetota bacterium]